MSNFQSHDDVPERSPAKDKQAASDMGDLSSKGNAQGLLEEGYGSGTRGTSKLPSAVVDNFVQATDSQIKDKAPSNDQVAEVFDRENPAKLPRAQMSDNKAQDIVRREFETRGVPLVDGMKIDLGGKRMDVAIVTDREGRRVMRTGDGDFYFRREADGQLRLSPKNDPNHSIEAAIVERGRFSTKSGDDAPSSKSVASEISKEISPLKGGDKASTIPLDNGLVGTKSKDLESTGQALAGNQVVENTRLQVGLTESGKEASLSANLMKASLESTTMAGEASGKSGNAELESKFSVKSEKVSVSPGEREVGQLSLEQGKATLLNNKNVELESSQAARQLVEKTGQNQTGIEATKRDDGVSAAMPMSGEKIVSEGKMSVTPDQIVSSEGGALSRAMRDDGIKTDLSVLGERKATQTEGIGEKVELTGKAEPSSARDGGGIAPVHGLEVVSSLVDQMTEAKDSASMDAETVSAEDESVSGGGAEAGKRKKRLNNEGQEEDDGVNADLLIAAEKLKEKMEREAKEQLEALQEDQRKKKQLVRAKYIVRERDTLESIAIRALRDVRLAPLILEINKDVIPCHSKDGKQVVFLKPKSVILLPSVTDIAEFRGRIPPVGQVKYEYASSEVTNQFLTPEEELAAKFGGVAEDYKGDTANVVTSHQGQTDMDVGKGKRSRKKTVENIPSVSGDRRANIEALLGPLAAPHECHEPIKYVVRLGDTLKSVAMRHPALKEVTLWKLLAEVNQLSTATDAKGVPVASLKRGMTIAIPTPEEIQQFHKAAHPNKPSPQSKADQEAQSEESERAMQVGPKHEESLDSPPILGPSVLEIDYTKQLFAAFEDEHSIVCHDVSSEQHEEETLLQACFPESSAKLEERELDEEIKQLDSSSRLVRSTRRLDPAGGVRSRLEIRIEESWRPVVIYEIYEDVSMRHEYAHDGTRKTIRIDLPPKSSEELAENDLASHWQEYIRKFLSGQRIDR